MKEKDKDKMIGLLLGLSKDMFVIAKKKICLSIGQKPSSEKDHCSSKRLFRPFNRPTRWSNRRLDHFHLIIHVVCLIDCLTCLMDCLAQIMTKTAG